MSLLLATLSLWLGTTQVGPTRLVGDRDRLAAADRASLGPLLIATEEPTSSRRAALRADLGAPPIADDSSLFEPLPEIEELGSPLPKDEPFGRSAAEWLALAREALLAKQYALADDFLRRALRRNPNDPEVRRLLGFVRHGQVWATPEAVRNLKAGKVLHPTFGWVPEPWLPQLDKGLLPALSKGQGGAIAWVPAQDADRSRLGDIDQAWLVRTSHFSIRANVPLAEGIVMGKRLEAFHQLFSSRMADVLGPDRLPLAARARKAGSIPLSSTLSHEVAYFASKDHYASHLAPSQGPDIGETLGIYIPAEVARRQGQSAGSYFHDDSQGRIALEATLYHEVSHQLLFELSGVSRLDRNTGHYWVFEGLGTYFETTRELPDGLIRIGGRYGPRMDEARKRCLDRAEFVPVREFLRLDKAGFNDPATIRQNYAQAIALANFLMDGDGGKHRAAFLTYVADAYKGRLRDDAGRSLDDRLGLSFAEIDEHLREHLAKPFASEAVRAWPAKGSSDRP